MEDGFPQNGDIKLNIEIENQVQFPQNEDVPYNSVNNNQYPQNNNMPNIQMMGNQFPQNNNMFVNQMMNNQFPQNQEMYSNPINNFQMNQYNDNQFPQNQEMNQFNDNQFPQTNIQMNQFNENPENPKNSLNENQYPQYQENPQNQENQKNSLNENQFNDNQLNDKQFDDNQSNDNQFNDNQFNYKEYNDNQPPQNDKIPVEPINENPKSDIEILKDNIKNKEKTKIVESICKLTNEQRQKLKESYLASYGTDLVKELESVLSGDAKDLILGLMKTPIDFDAEQIYLSMKGLGTDEETLSEMIATRPSRQLIKIRERYPELYNETLESDIKGDTSKYYKNILIAMIQGQRSDNPYPNTEKMKEIVEKLKDDDEFIKDNFVSYLVNCSYGEICTISREYEKTYGKSILDGIKAKFGQDENEFFKILFNYISNPAKYFAEKIHDFKTKKLIRIVVSRSEDILDDIKDSYKELYNTELIDDIKNNTDNDFQLGLVTLIEK